MCVLSSPAGSDDVSEVEQPSETQPAGQSQGAVCEVEIGDGVPSVSSEPRESVEETHEPVQEGEGDEMTTEQERVRDRRITYSVSPKQPTNTSPNLDNACLHDDGVAMATDNNRLRDDGVATPTSGSRKRRRTHSVSPSSSLLLSGTISLETADSTANAAPEVPSGVRSVSSLHNISLSLSHTHPLATGVYVLVVAGCAPVKQRRKK